jgi:hypothetical protein
VFDLAFSNAKGVRRAKGVSMISEKKGCVRKEKGDIVPSPMYAIAREYEVTDKRERLPRIRRGRDERDVTTTN